jgi:hypothetical protein
MSAFTNSFASSLLASSILISGVTPVLAQYSCPSREIQSVHEVGDLKFELQGCQRSGKKVTCSAWATNLKRDYSYFFSRDETRTRLVDTSGEQYLSSSTQPSSTSLVKDVPLKISVTFKDVPTSIQDIALFEISWNGYGGDYGTGQLRNIKITESKIGNSPSPVKKKK